MAFVLKDRVREVCTTEGTGPLRFAGAPSGYQNFSSVLATSDTTLVLVVDGAGNWETFLGTWDASAKTMARTTTLESSNGGAAVSLTGEGSYAWINYPAARHLSPQFQTLTFGVNQTTTAVLSGGASSVSVVMSPVANPLVVDRYLDVGSPASRGRTQLYGPLDGSNRALLVNQSIIMSGSVNANITRYESALSGSTTANPAIFTHSLSDNVQAAAGINWSIHSINYGGTSFQGARNGLWININSNADSTNNGDAFLVALAPWWRANHYHNGYPGAERGSVWGSNPLGFIGNSGTIGARRMRGAQGMEVNVGAKFDLFYRTNLRFVEWGPSPTTDNTGIGRWQDAAASFGRLAGVGLPGHRTLFALGDVLGHWPLASAGATLMEPIVSQVASDPANTASGGFNLPAVTFDHFAWWSQGTYIGGTGNIGGNAVSGTTLQTTSQILARSGGVASVTVARGGLFLGRPTLTCSSPSGGGTTAVLTVNAMAVAGAYAMTGIFGARGTGYTVGDTLTMSGGTFTTAAVFTVRAVDSTGQIIDLDATTQGSYTVNPANPVTLTGGTGTGATVSPYWTILSVTVSTAGTTYSEHKPPEVTVSGGSGAQFQRPILIPVMSATQTNLSLNPGGSVLIGTQTPASAAASGTTGTVTWDSNYIYVATGTNTWKRVAIATW